MNKYKIVACDIDGTLLNDELKVSDQNKSAINSLTKKGVHFVPTTGRTLSEMQEIAENPDIRYIIYSNGAAILDKDLQKYTYMCISKDRLSFVLDTLMSCKSFLVVHHGGKTYMDNLDEDKFEEYNLCYAVQELLKHHDKIEENFEELVYSMDNVECVSAFFCDDNDKERCKNIISNDEKLYVVDGWEHNIEIFSADAGKDKALKRLAEDLDVDMENVISIGDSGNDIEMTKIAGLGLSTANGCEELKKVADKVICSNKEHVVEYVLSEYFDDVKNV